MIAPPMWSPVAVETTPADRRIRDSGSSSRRRIAPTTLVRLGVRRCWNRIGEGVRPPPLSPRPAVPQPSSAQSRVLATVQNGAGNLRQDRSGRRVRGRQGLAISQPMRWRQETLRA